MAELARTLWSQYGPTVIQAVIFTFVTGVLGFVWKTVAKDSTSAKVLREVIGVLFVGILLLIWKGLPIALCSLGVYAAWRYSIWIGFSNRQRIEKLESHSAQHDTVEDFVSKLKVCSGQGAIVSQDGKNWRPAELVSAQHAPIWRDDLPPAKWIAHREKVNLEEAQEGCTYDIRHPFTVPDTAAPGTLRGKYAFRVDDIGTVLVNGEIVDRGSDHPKMFKGEIPQSYLRIGENQLEFRVQNKAMKEAQQPQRNPTGLLYRVDIGYAEANTR